MYTTTSSFKFGLDSRRSELSAVPGSLIDATDGHITQGGEFEKRKSFVATALPANTLGFQETSNGIYVFGTAAPASVTTTAPIIYQQLLHPKTIAGLGAVALSAIVSSTQYNNFPFVTALFADGSKYCYYNGQIVSDFVYGFVANYMTTNTLVAAMMDSAVSATVDYTAVQNTGTVANEVSAFSLPSNSYSVVASVASMANITVTTTQDVNYTQANVYATGLLNANDGALLTLGTQVYRFKNTMASAFDVQIGATIAATLTNLYLAINASGTPGTNYFTGTTANTVVYAQNLAIATTPTFQLVAFAPNTLLGNTQGIVENNITGINYIDESNNIPRAIATQAVGQFAIQQLIGGGQATGTVQFNGVGVTDGQNFTIAGVTYTYKAAPVSARQIFNFIFPAFGLTTAQLMQLATAAIINGQSTFKVGTNVVTAGVAGTADANVTANASGAFPGAGYVGLTAIALGSAGNAIALTASNAGVQVSSANLVGGASANLSGGFTSQVNSITVGTSINGIASTGTITTNGTNVSNGDTVTIGNLIYTFVTAAPASNGQVAIGANALASLTNLLLAINGTGTQLLNYDITGPNPLAIAVATLNGNVLQLNSRLGGTSQNTVNLLKSAATLTVSALTLLGGLDGVNILATAVESTSGQTPGQFAATLLGAINANSVVSGYYASVIGNTVYIYTTIGNSLSNNATITVSVTGTICIGFCAFEFNEALLSGHTSATGSCTMIQINGVTALSGTVTLNGTSDTITTFAASVAANINTQVGGTYIAIAIGPIVYLSRLITSSVDAPLNVVISLRDNSTTDTLSVSQVGQNNLVAVVAPTYIGFVRYPAGTQVKQTILTGGGLAGSSVASDLLVGPTGVVVGAIAGAFGLGKHKSYITAEYSPIICSCQAAGGYPPYTYLWTQSGGDNGFVVSESTLPNITFSRPDNPGSNSATFVCVVTDSLGNQVTSNSVTVKQP